MAHRLISLRDSVGRLILQITGIHIHHFIKNSPGMKSGRILYSGNLWICQFFPEEITAVGKSIFQFVPVIRWFFRNPEWA